MVQRVALGLVPALVLSIALAAPAAALQRFNVFMTGELVPLGTPSVIGLPFGFGTTVTASWDIDVTAGTRVALPPLGGQGTAARFSGTVSNGFIALATDTEILLLGQNSLSEGNIFALDNAAANPMNPALRFDQVTINDGASYDGTGPLPTYTFLPIAGSFGEDIHVSSVSFGRLEVLNGADPTLIDTTETIDPFSLWQFGFVGPQPLFGLTFRQGSATTPEGAALLPNSRFSIRTASVFLTELPTDIIPEPGSWAMLIAGFGLVGAAARRQRRLERRRLERRRVAAA